MDSKPKAVYRPSKGFTYYFILLCGFAALFGGGYVMWIAFQKLYPDLIMVFFACILILFGLYAIYSYLGRKTIWIYDDILVLKSNLFYKETRIPLREITSWAEIHKKNKNNSWDELTIITDAKKYRFESYNYTDYTDLKNNIVRHIPQNIEFEKILEARIILKISICLIAVGIMFLIFSFFNLNANEKALTPGNFYQTKQIITSEVKIHKGSKGARSITLTFEDYPEFDFKISGDAYDAMYADEFVSNVKTYDTVYITLVKDDYEKKLAKTKPLSFFDKTISYYHIDICGVATKNENYLNLSDYFAEVRDRHQNNGWIFAGIGAVLSIIGVFGLLKKNKIAAV